MYISNFLILDQGSNYNKYKNINKYDEAISSSNLLNMNNPINLLDIYNANSINDISSITDSFTLNNNKLYNLHRYTYDENSNPNGPIKKEANTNKIVTLDNRTNNYNYKLFFISDDKVLSENTFNSSGNIIILHSLDYYFYYNINNSSSLNLGVKPSHFKFNNTNIINSSYIIGNIDLDIINKIETNTLDDIYILFKTSTISSDDIKAINNIFVLCYNKNINKYKFKLDDSIQNYINNTNYNYLYYISINKTTSFKFSILNKNDDSVVKEVNITVGQ